MTLSVVNILIWTIQYSVLLNFSLPVDAIGHNAEHSSNELYEGSKPLSSSFTKIALFHGEKQGIRALDEFSRILLYRQSYAI